MLADYHMHSFYSFDASFSPEEMIKAAAERNIGEVCFTEHIDFDDSPQSVLPDRAKYIEHIRSLMPEYMGVRVKIGAEIGLKDRHTAKEAWAFLEEIEPDFIIGSVHVVNGIDAYYPEYYDGKTKRQAFVEYLQTAKECVKSCGYMSVLGHYDFVTKFSPYEDRTLSYFDYRELLDEILIELIKGGRAPELNTASWRDDKAWGTEFFRRFRELGGEYVTLGSDAHRPQRVAKRFDEAKAMLEAAGIKYIATFDRLKANPVRL